MKRRWGVWLLILNVAVLVGLVFAYPDLMISPGSLTAGHTSLNQNCFACHAPLTGASTERCMACHKLPDIGVRSTTGVAKAPSVGQELKTAFHQSLLEGNCMACHNDHPGSTRFARQRPHVFSHQLLRPHVRSQCANCHRPPDNAMHRKQGADCQQCHTTNGWRPATFEHDQFFKFDRKHAVACATCHQGSGYATYTCYGCHEHTLANIRAEHDKEVGGRNLDNCVACHRSPDEKVED